MRSDHEHRCRLNFQVGLAPNFALQRNAGVELFQRLAFPDVDPVAHGFAAAFLARAPDLTCFSVSFALSHSNSISARGTSANARPEPRAIRSISRNREVNFALLRL